MLTELEPEIGTAAPGRAAIGQVPVPAPPRDGRGGRVGRGIETWDEFLARGRDEPRELVEATAAAVRPSDAAVLFFSSGSTSKPKGILSAHRGVCIQCGDSGGCTGSRPDDDVRCWTANGFFWSGQFRHGAGRDLRQRRFARAAADLQRRRGAGADADRAGELSVRLAAPVGAARRRTQLGHSGSEQHAVRRFQVPDRAPPDGVEQVVRAGSCLRQHRDLHDHNVFPGQHAGRRDARAAWAWRCRA